MPKQPLTWSSDETLHQVDLLSKVIQEATDKSVPWDLPTEGDKPWWNEVIHLLRQNMRQLIKAARLPYPDTKAQRKAALVAIKWKQARRQPKWTYWEHHLQDTNRISAWKIINTLGAPS